METDKSCSDRNLYATLNFLFVYLCIGLDIIYMLQNRGFPSCKPVVKQYYEYILIYWAELEQCADLLLKKCVLYTVHTSNVYVSLVHLYVIKC